MGKSFTFLTVPSVSTVHFLPHFGTLRGRTPLRAVEIKNLAQGHNMLAAAGLELTIVIV